MIPTAVVDNGTIRLGLVNDNLATVIQFPIANFYSFFGTGGTFYVINKRPDDSNAYAVPPEYISITDNMLSWTLTSYDVEQDGNGECQLAYYLGNVKKMSQRWRTAVGASLIPTEIAPDPYQTWLDRLDAIARRAEAAATRAEEAETKTPHIGSNGNWLIWDAVNEEWVDSGTSARPSFVVVGALPAEGQSGIIYLVPSADPGVENIYDEYIWVGTDYELIGTTAIDLSGYVPKTWLDGTDTVNTFQVLSDNGVSIYAETDVHISTPDARVQMSNGGLDIYGIDDVSISSDGTVEIDGYNNTIVHSGGDATVEADGDVTVHSDNGGITLSGSHATFNGKNLLTEQDDTGITDTTPYNLRAETRNAIAKKPTFVGATVAWNQLVQATDTSCTVPSGHKYISYLSGTWAVGSSSGSAFTVDGANGDKVFDLTAMFGSALADYIHGLGNTNGVAYFRSLFPSASYAYNAGTLYSVNPDKSITKSADQSETSTYELNHPTLNGLFKLDAGNNLYADGDIYPPTGQITRKCIRVNLGDLNWQSTTSALLGQYYYAAASALGIKYIGNYGLTLYPAINPKYVQVKRVAASFVDKTITFDGSVGNVTQIQIKDSDYADATALKTSLNGVYLVCELATPTTETAETFDEKETVYQGGTEALTDYAYEQGTRDVAIPVGHSTVYLRKMIMVPAPPVLNGTYTLTATVNNGSTVIDWQ